MRQAVCHAAWFSLSAFAEISSISRLAVWQRRTKLRIRPHTKHRKHANWGTTELGMLGRYSDDELAKITGRTLEQVKAKRLSLMCLRLNGR